MFRENASVELTCLPEKVRTIQTFSFCIYKSYFILSLFSFAVVLHFPEYGSREVQLNFITDGSDSRRGFYVEYIQELCPSPKPTGGHSYPLSDSESKSDANGNGNSNGNGNGNILRAGSFSVLEYP